MRPIIQLLAVLLAATLPVATQQHHWEETASETIWQQRYTNCDYGYYVTLPVGVVAHGTHSPAPNHGFLVSLPDTSRKSAASFDDARFVWVDAHYNVSDFQSLSSVAENEVETERENQHAFRVLERSTASIAGLPAIRYRVEYERGTSSVVETQTIAVRSGIIYTVGLRTDSVSFTADERQFKAILKGFNWLKLPHGECSND